MIKLNNSFQIRNSQRLLVYHYEDTNDGRRILIFEPNVFKDFKEANVHASCLAYLSGREFCIIPEESIGELDLLISDVLVSDNVS